MHLVPLHCGAEAALLDPLAETLAEVFQAEVSRCAPWFDPDEALDPRRQQYDSREMLRRLRVPAQSSCSRVLGVAGVDLCIPILTYVFGEAELDGRAAVVSTYRLNSVRYGLPPDPERLFERLVKEAVHELGHTFGLRHCTRDDCVMSSSTYVEGIDQKRPRFCGRCLRAARGSLEGAGFRYVALR